MKKIGVKYGVFIWEKMGTFGVIFWGKKFGRFGHFNEQGYRGNFCYEKKVGQKWGLLPGQLIWI